MTLLEQLYQTGDDLESEYVCIFICSVSVKMPTRSYLNNYSCVRDGSQNNNSSEIHLVDINNCSQTDL